MNHIWLKCEFKVDELKGKKVLLDLDDGYGLGEFEVFQKEDKISLVIITRKKVSEEESQMIQIPVTQDMLLLLAPSSSPDADWEIVQN